MAWTFTTTLDRNYNVTSELGNEILVIKIAATSDASSGTYYLQTAIKDSLGTNYWESIRGKWLYAVGVVPGTGDDVPADVFDIEMQNGDGIVWFDKDDLAVDANVIVSGAVSAGIYPIIEDNSTIVFTTLGDENKANFYFYIMRG